MKNSEGSDFLDQQFIKAIDQIIKTNKGLGITPKNDSAIGEIIYPSSKSIISAVRSKRKHIPHSAVYNMSKHFDLNMNFFYDSNASLNYNPKLMGDTIISENGIVSKGKQSVNILSNTGQIENFSNKNETQTSNPITQKSLEANTMINNFISDMEADRVQEFFNIISFLQKDNKICNEKIYNLLDQNAKDLRFLKNECERKNVELSQAREKIEQYHLKLEEVQLREIKLYRELLDLKK